MLLTLCVAYGSAATAVAAAAVDGRSAAAASVSLQPGGPAAGSPAMPGGTPPRAPIFFAVPGEREFTGELIARPRQDLPFAQRGAVEQVVRGMARRHIPQTDEFILTVGTSVELPGVAEQRVADQLMASGLFQYVHPNWMVFPTEVPNDPHFGLQWHHTVMESPAAWNLHTGDPAVIVAVTDTGIVDHEDLGNRVPGYNAVSGQAEADGGDIWDINGHGTHVAGCAAAQGNNATGVAGVGWNLSVMPIRVSELANGNATYEALLDGARWAAEHGAKVVSASYSGAGYEAQEITAQYIRSLGGSYLWAAGNSATDHAGFDFEHLLVVGASNALDQRADFSGYGRGTDLFAPGVNILSTINSGGYGYASGTSMATPVANGVLGMIRSANPALTAAHAEHILLHTCDPWGEYDNEEFGFGRVNLRRAIEEAIAAFVPAPPVGRNDRVKGVVGQTYLLDVLNNDYDRNMDPLVIDVIPGVSSMGDPLTLLPGGGPGGRDAVQISILPGSPAGTRSFTYTLREPGSGATAQATAFVEAQQGRAATPVVGSASGLQVAYYAVPGLDQLPDWSTLTSYGGEVVPYIYYPSTDEEFAGSGLADDVGAVYDGWLYVPQSGLWTLGTQSDDGSMVRIADQVVVDNDGLHGMQTRIGTVALEQGYHPLRVEFFERGGGAGLIFIWSGPGISTQVVPDWALSHGGSVNVADLNGDGVVNGADLGLLLAAWGSCAGCPADLNGDGQVNGADLGLLLAAWG